MQSSLLDRVHLAAGAILFSAGEAGASAYLIESGILEIFLARPEGDLVLARRGPGEIVGEMSIIDRHPRSASVRALEPCALVMITEQQLAHRIGETDPILRMCLGVVIERYRETVAMLQQMQGAAPPLLPAPPSVASEGFSAAMDTLLLEREIRAGLERSEFVLFFQPIVRLNTGRLAGFETLMRWQHPVRGLVPPADFIPVAESSGLIADLTNWAFEEVGRVFPEIMLASLHNPEAIEGPLFLSVNVSGHDLAGASFPEGIAAFLARSGIAANCLKIEVTESTLMKDPDRAAAALATCRASGVGISIDDFGTGYSSLSYLSTLPVTTLKIDRAFVRAMLGDATSRRIVQTILRLADELEIPVVAEGIEHGPEADALVEMGCAFGQGYLYGRPVSMDETLECVRGWASTRAGQRRVA